VKVEHKSKLKGKGSTVVTSYATDLREKGKLKLKAKHPFSAHNSVVLSVVKDLRGRGKLSWNHQVRV
jgi:hypothetical protein